MTQQIPGAGAAPQMTTEAVTAVAGDDESIAVASQWKLVWWGFKRHRVALVCGIITLFIYLVAVFAPEEWYWMPFCVALGCVVHILGDLITTNGVPLFWPLKPRSPRWMRDGKGIELDHLWRRGGNIALPILGNAGSAREWALLVPISLYAVVGIVWALLSQMGYDTMGLWTQLTGL
jgi:membrane-bound metal-dependent hydrolase YbcI (DUF457 family)